MKPVLLAMLLLLNPPGDVRPAATAVAGAEAAYNLSIDAPWTAKIGKSDPAKLQFNVSERKGSMLGVGVPIAELEGLSAAAGPWIRPAVQGMILTVSPGIGIARAVGPAA